MRFIKHYLAYVLADMSVLMLFLDIWHLYGVYKYVVPGEVEWYESSAPNIHQTCHIVLHSIVRQSKRLELLSRPSLCNFVMESTPRGAYRHYISITIYRLVLYQHSQIGNGVYIKTLGNIKHIIKSI